MAQANPFEGARGSDRTITVVRLSRSAELATRETEGLTRGSPQMRPEQNLAAGRQRPTTVVLVDDEHLIRAALAHTLASSGIELVGEAATGEDAINLVLDVRPDVVLMDLRFPGTECGQAFE